MDFLYINSSTIFFFYLNPNIMKKKINIYHFAFILYNIIYKNNSLLSLYIIRYIEIPKNEGCPFNKGRAFIEFQTESQAQEVNNYHIIIS